MYECSHTLAARAHPPAPCNLFVVVPYRNDHACLYREDRSTLTVPVNTRAWWDGERRAEAPLCTDAVERALLEMTGAYTLRVRVAGEWLWVTPDYLSDVPYDLAAWMP